MNSLEKFNALINDFIKPVLKKNGFIKSSLHFYKREEDFIKFISIEKSSWNTNENVKFSFNIHVFDFLAYKYIGEGEILPKLPVNTFYSIISTDLSELSRQKKDRYEISKETEIDKLFSVIEKDIYNYIIPYIDKFNSKEDLYHEYCAAGNEAWRARGTELFAGIHEIEFGNKLSGISKIKNCQLRWSDNDFWNNKLNKLIEKITNVV
ncbi:MAG: hypothetical protein A2W91_15750 [Bacteroidetes bacterium GWF2_38_335]|nr:MAG: hypothetical protein A2W91_15750 [Bacteroidetes bacterium GWF2_38_335]HBS85259.1 hypothetical protein [Bacteroidales bacterium]